MAAVRSKANPTTWWLDLSLTRKHAMCLGVLLITAVGFFAPVHFSGQSIIASDTVNWRGMAQSVLAFEDATGEPGLWAGHAFGGMPAYMISPETGIPQPDDIMRVLRDWFWPSSHLFLMFAGMYLLGWVVTEKPLAGLFAAVSYGLTTYMPVILIAGHNSKFIALAWAPWLLAAFFHLLKRPGLVASLLFAAAVAANLRAGHVQITYYAVIGAGIWWTFEAVTRMRAGEIRTFLATNGWVLLGSVLGLALVAQPYLSHAEFADFTIRGVASGGAQGGMGWDYAMAWSQGVGELLTLLIADAYGGSGTTYWGPKIFTAGPHYIGGLVVLMAIVGMTGTRRKATWPLVTAIVFMTLFSLGEYFPVLNRPMFEWFPLFAAFRVPETWLSMVALFLSLLAATGLATLLDGSRDARKATWMSWTPMRVAGGCIAVVGLLYVMGGTVLDFEKPGEQTQILRQVQAQYPTVRGDEPQVAQVIREEMARRYESRIELFSKDARRTLLILLLAAIVLFLYHRRSIPGWAVAGTFVLLVVVDLGGVGRRYVNADILTESESVIDEIPVLPYDSWLLDRQAEAGGEGSFRVLSFEFGRDPSQNGRPSFFYESLGGYTAAKLRVYQDFLDHMLFTPGRTGLNERALKLMNVQYLVADRGPVGWQLAFQDDRTGMSVFAAPSATRRAWFVDSVTVTDSPESAWDTMQMASFDPYTEAIVFPQDAELAARLSGPSGADSLTSVSRISWEGGQRMSFRLSTERERMLVLSEVYYPAGWVARLDGEEIDIVQVDYLLRGMVIPAGEHTLELSFEPATHTAGMWISGVASALVYGSLLLLLGLWFVRRRS